MAVKNVQNVVQPKLCNRKLKLLPIIVL